MTFAPVSRSRSRLVLVLVGFAVSILFGYLAVRDVRWAEVWDALRTSNYWWLLPWLALCAVTVFIRAVRWQMLFAPATRPPLLAITSSLVIGQFFNNVLPARAGEAARVVALRRQTKTSAVEAAGTVVSERVLDGLVLLALLFVASPFLPAVGWIEAAAALAGAGLVCTVVLVIVLARFGSRPFRALARLVGRIPGVRGDSLEHAADSLVRGFAVFRDPRMAAIAIGLTAASWLSLSFAFWLGMIGFDMAVGFGAGLLVVIATDLALILPSSPAGLGVFEAAAITALSVYAVDDSTALSYAIVVHAAIFFLFVVLGYVALHWHVVSVRRASLSAIAPPEAAPSPPRG